MTDLFEWAEGRKLRDEGMRLVDEHADELWKRDMTALLREVLETLPIFTTDDVFDLARAKGVTSTTRDRRALGPIVMRAAKAGLCAKVNCAPRPSNRKELHASPLSVWRSLICQRSQ